MKCSFLFIFLAPFLRPDWRTAYQKTRALDYILLHFGWEISGRDLVFHSIKLKACELVVASQKKSSLRVFFFGSRELAGVAPHDLITMQTLFFEILCGLGLMALWHSNFVPCISKIIWLAPPWLPQDTKHTAAMIYYPRLRCWFWFEFSYLLLSLLFPFVLLRVRAQLTSYYGFKRCCFHQQIPLGCITSTDKVFIRLFNSVFFVFIPFEGFLPQRVARSNWLNLSEIWQGWWRVGKVLIGWHPPIIWFVIFFWVCLQIRVFLAVTS